MRAMPSPIWMTVPDLLDVGRDVVPLDLGLEDGRNLVWTQLHASLPIGRGVDIRVASQFLQATADGGIEEDSAGLQDEASDDCRIDAGVDARVHAERVGDPLLERLHLGLVERAPRWSRRRRGSAPPRPPARRRPPAGRGGAPAGRCRSSPAGRFGAARRTGRAGATTIRCLAACGSSGLKSARRSGRLSASAWVSSARSRSTPATRSASAAAPCSAFA